MIQLFIQNQSRQFLLIFYNNKIEEISTHGETTLLFLLFHLFIPIAMVAHPQPDVSLMHFKGAFHQ